MGSLKGEKVFPSVELQSSLTSLDMSGRLLLKPRPSIINPTPIGWDTRTRMNFGLFSEEGVFFWAYIRVYDQVTDV
jgi:hypothetical protein